MDPTRLVPRVSFIVPVFNEERTIEMVIARTAALPVTKEIIVVDDCSDDGTQEALRRAGDSIVNVRLPVNSGRGSAIRAGIGLARGEVVALIDADLEVAPELSLSLVETVAAGQADFVVGSRFLSGAAHDMTFAQRQGNRVLTGLANLLLGSQLTDIESGTVAIRRDLLQELPLRSRRWDLSIEMAVRLARRRARIVELPIAYAPRSRVAGKKLAWSDFFGALYFILKYRILPA